MSCDAIDVQFEFCRHVDFSGATAVRHPNHAEHKEMLRWVGGAFDPEAFDLNQVNRKLQRMEPRPRKLLSR